MPPHNTELLLFDKQNHKAPHRHHIVCIAWHTFNQIASSFGERLNCVLLQCVLIDRLCKCFAKMLSSGNTSLLEYHNTRMRQPPYRLRPKICRMHAYCMNVAWARASTERNIYSKVLRFICLFAVMHRRRAKIGQ